MISFLEKLQKTILRHGFQRIYAILCVWRKLWIFCRPIDILVRIRMIILCNVLDLFEFLKFCWEKINCFQCSDEKIIIIVVFIMVLIILIINRTCFFLILGKPSFLKMFICIKVDNTYLFDFFFFINLNANDDIKPDINMQKVDIALFDFFLQKYQYFMKIINGLEWQDKSLNVWRSVRNIRF